MRRALLVAALVALAACTQAAASAAPRRSHPIAGLVRDIPTGAHVRRPVLAGAANLPYGGGPVLHSNRTHVIFWEPSGSGLHFEGSYEGLIENFLRRVAADSHKTTNVYGLSGQYRDAQGPAAYASTYEGSVLDTDPLPPNACTEPATGPGWHVCLTDTQLQTEIDHVVAADRLPTDMGDVYFLVLPRGFASCVSSGPEECALGGSGSGYCGYHSATANGVLYAVIPFNAVPGHCQSGNPRPNRSPADPAISTISHEHNEMVTDPEGNAWINSDGEEDGDLCIMTFGHTLGGNGSHAYNEVIGGGHYYLQEEWSNENHQCEPRAKPDHLWVAAPGRRRARTPLQFVAHARMPYGSITAYNWYFGDGSTGHGRVAVHTFSRSGSFRVVLRTTDSADNWAWYGLTIWVARDRRSAGRRAS